MEKIIKTIKERCEKKLDNNNIIVKKQKNREFGDLSIVLFPLVKKIGKDVKAIADLLIPELNEIESIKKAVFEKGFLNIYIKRDLMLKNLWKRSCDNLNDNKNNGERIVIDYSSPNIAKPFSIGHLRSTIIGNILANIYEEKGYDVVRVNHLGDWGTQFGKVLVAINKWGDWNKIKEDPVKELLALYVKFHNEAEHDEGLEDEAREVFSKLEKKDSKYFKDWEYIVKISIENIEKIYKRLGVRFDKYLGESFYEPLMDNVLERLQEKGLVTQSEGALVVNLEDYKMPPCLLRKKDGSSLYALRDITAVLYRIEEMKANKLVYVVGNEQKLHFKQVFKVIELFRPDLKDCATHVGFGLYKFKDMKMSTRKGNVIFMEDVLDDACEKAKQIMKERDFEDQELNKVSDIIGTGAVIFNDICSDRVKDVDFNWDKILDFNGETAPYVQYTAVRIKSILKRSELRSENIDLDELEPIEEYMPVLKHTESYSEVLQRCMEKDQPYILANFLIDLCSLFNSFYNNVRIITDNKKETQNHIIFISLILKYIEKGLDILGISIPERM